MVEVVTAAVESGQPVSSCHAALTSSPQNRSNHIAAAPGGSVRLRLSPHPPSCATTGLVTADFLSGTDRRTSLLRRTSPAACGRRLTSVCSVRPQVIILIGNKADLEAQRDVTYEEAKQFAEENGELHMQTVPPLQHSAVQIEK